MKEAWPKIIMKHIEKAFILENTQTYFFFANKLRYKWLLVIDTLRFLLYVYVTAWPCTDKNFVDNSY